jgi:hyperosmotically inducible protein
MSGKAWMRSLIAVGSVFGAAAPALAQSPPPPLTAVAVEAEAQPAQPAITDATITESIKAKLQDDKTLRTSQVTVISKEGVVTVVGTVHNEFARDQVFEAVRSTPGVLRVDDQLRIDVSSPQGQTRN